MMDMYWIACGVTLKVIYLTKISIRNEIRGTVIASSEVKIKTTQLPNPQSHIQKNKKTFHVKQELEVVRTKHVSQKYKISCSSQL